MLALPVVGKCLEAPHKDAIGPKGKVSTANQSSQIPERLEVAPAEITLSSRRAYRQLVVTGYFHGEPRDLTQDAEYSVSNHQTVKVTDGRVFAVGDGKAILTVRCGGKMVHVPVAVVNATKPEPVRFKFETLPILTKQGCANGSCHGSPHGKGGFSLSLFGYDPTIDRITLTRDGFNRRTDVLEPDESLILKKPLLEIPHVGGKRLRKSDVGYGLLREWIYEGANTEIPAVGCAHIVITPGTARVLHSPHLKQQLSVVATLTDGTTHDVTAIATYDTSSASVATVDANGLVTGHGRGQAAISVRYLDKLQSAYITVVEDVPGFIWNNPHEITQNNNFIDKLVDAKLKQLQYLPSAVCTDDVFLRRLHLDLTGMLPTAEQARHFLKDTSINKRARLVDTLLDSEDYARFWALKQADLMRVTPAKLKDGRAELFANWITDATRKNMPYDKFARAILTAEGDTGHVAPANYFLAIPTMEERTEMTTEVFMGSRIECAKCHNHPFESWTMRDYYSISAVWARTQNDNGEIKLADTGEAMLPTTQEVMASWGAEVKTPALADRRIAFVDWLTKPGNPYFARVEVNRLWADLLGHGIVDPVDDFRSSNPPSNVPLLDTLAQEFERSNYDRKHILRLICNSRTYQSANQTNKFNASDDTLFSHVRVRMLTAEQLKDAIGLVTHVLESTDVMQAQLIALNKQSETRAATLEAKFPVWLDEKTRRIAQLPFWQGGWYAVGPFKTANLNTGLKETFGPESTATNALDLATAFPGNLHWSLQTALRDGVNNPLTPGRNQVHFLTRRLYAANPRSITVEIRAGDSCLAWLNGHPVMKDNQPLRGTQKVTLNLQKGDNRLLLKVVNSAPRVSFQYRFDESALANQPANQSLNQSANQQETGKNAGNMKLDVPPYLIDLLAIPAERRTEEQRRLLHDQFISMDSDIRNMKQQIDRMESRMAYATQRPYPEASEFTITFGQPKRETGCTCERQRAPTLLQALELLNGGTAYQMAQASAARYLKLDNDHLIEELYLSALSRFPTDKERGIAKLYLEKASDRTIATTDLVWTVLNTQEFLFQH